jgi:hypothetical protein
MIKSPEVWICDRVSGNRCLTCEITYVVDGLLIQVLGRNDLLDDLLLDLLSHLLRSDIFAVLSTDNNSVDFDWDNSSVIMFVLDSDLGLSIRSEPWQATVSASSRHSSVELVCQLEGQGEQFRGLISGISEYDTLITRTQFLKGFLVVKTLRDIGRLLLNGNQHIASLVVETLLGIIVTNVLDRISNDLLVVETSLGGDLAKDHNHTSLGGGFASYLGKRVLSQASIEDSIRDLISYLVWMTFSYRLGLSFWSAVGQQSSGRTTYGEQERALVVVWLHAVCAIGLNGHDCDLRRGFRRSYRRLQRSN